MYEIIDLLTLDYLHKKYRLTQTQQSNKSSLESGRTFKVLRQGFHEFPMRWSNRAQVQVPLFINDRRLTYNTSIPWRRKVNHGADRL